jgi:hypothetical protein
MSKAAELAALIGSQTALSNRNLLINGGMQVAQRGNTTDHTSGGVYAPDRFKFNVGSLGTWDISKSTESPANQGFSNSLKLDCTATASVSSGSFMLLQQILEGQDVQQLKFGTANAESITFSFWIKSSKTGLVTVEIQHKNTSGNFFLRSSTFTIDSANTWEKKIITIVGNTAQDINNDNSACFYLSYWFSAGSDFNGGTFNTSAWLSSTGNTNTRVSGSSINFADSTSNEIYITGAQLEVGEQATAFEHRSFGDELLQCQRYFVNYPDTSSATNTVFVGRGNGSTQAVSVMMPLPVVMRAKPTVSQISQLAAIGPSGYNAANNVTPTVTGTPDFEPNLALAFTGLSGLTDNRLAGVYIYNPFSLSAEL